MSSDTVILYNNRLGHTTLAAPRELPAAARAALQVRLRMAPGASVTVPRDVWLLMAKNAGNQKYVESGEISTRREDVERRRPPTNLAKLNRGTLGAPRGAGDFVHGLRADPALLRDVESARRSTPGASTRVSVARASLDAAPAGDYEALLRELQAGGVSLSALREATERLTVAATAPREVRPHDTKPSRAATEHQHDVKLANEPDAALLQPVDEVQPSVAQAAAEHVPALSASARDEDGGSKHAPADRSSGRPRR
jgi:hypothetical protein